MSTSTNNTVSEESLTALINEIAVAAHAQAACITANREVGQSLVVLPLLEANKLVDIYQKLEALPGPDDLTGAARLDYWIRMHQAAREQAIRERIEHEQQLTPYQRFTDVLSKLGVKWQRSETAEDGSFLVSIDTDHVLSGEFLDAKFNRVEGFVQFEVTNANAGMDVVEGEVIVKQITAS